MALSPKIGSEQVVEIDQAGIDPQQVTRGGEQQEGHRLLEALHPRAGPRQGIDEMRENR